MMPSNKLKFFLMNNKPFKMGCMTLARSKKRGERLATDPVRRMVLAVSSAASCAPVSGQPAARRGWQGLRTTRWMQKMQKM